MNIADLDAAIDERECKRTALDAEITTLRATKKARMLDLAAQRVVNMPWPVLKTLILDDANWSTDDECDSYDLVNGACRTDDCYCQLHPGRVGSIELHVFDTFDHAFKDELRFCSACLDRARTIWFEDNESLHSNGTYAVDPDALSASGQRLVAETLAAEARAVRVPWSTLKQLVADRDNWRASDGVCNTAACRGSDVATFDSMGEMIFDGDMHFCAECRRRDLPERWLEDNDFTNDNCEDDTFRIDPETLSTASRKLIA